MNSRITGTVIGRHAASSPQSPNIDPPQESSAPGATAAERQISDSFAIALAQQSIDRHPNVSVANIDGNDIETDIERLAISLELLGSLERRPLAPSTSLDKSFKIGRFEVKGEQGRGGFGIVLRAFDPILRRDVALKVPRPERLIAGQSPDDFVREAQLAARLEHPGIVRVYEARRLGPVWYIASAFCEGPTMADWLYRQQPHVKPHQTVQLVANIAEAVHYAHTRGVLHLDLKPENILLDISEGTGALPQPLITDFGLAGLSEDTAGEARMRIAGTLAYMAPEQRAGDSRRIGVAADVYALGAILYDVLAGKPGLQNTCRGEAIADSGVLDPPPRPPLSDSPRDLTAICQKCLQQNPDERYDSARELANDLRRYLRGEPVLARPTSWVGTTLRLVQRRPAVSALCIVLTATIVASIAVVGKQWRRAEANLISLRAEQASHARTAERMRKSLLNLTWLTQENQLRRDEPESHDEVELRLLRDFCRDVESWSADTAPEDASDAALRAAGHSLALVDCVKALHEHRATDEFLAGLHAWKAVISLEPTNERWRRALALHLLTYSAGLDAPNWLWWREAMPDGIDIDSETATLFEEPYADLLVQYAGNVSPFRSPVVARQMLQVAIQLLTERHDLPDPDYSRHRSLLAAFNELANMDARLSKTEECHASLAAAKSMVFAAPPASECPPPLSLAIGDTFKTSFKVRERSQDLSTTLSDLSLAADYYSRGLAASPDDVPLRITLSDIHYNAATLGEHEENNQLAIHEFQSSLDVLDAGLSRSPGHRELIRRRAIVESNLGRLLYATGEISSGEKNLLAATCDFRDMKLSKQDSTSLWMQAVRVWQMLGKSYAIKGDRQTARDAYQRSLEYLEGVKGRREHTIQYHEYLSRTRDSLAALRVSTDPSTDVQDE